MNELVYAWNASKTARIYASASASASASAHTVLVAHVLKIKK